MVLNEMYQTFFSRQSNNSNYTSIHTWSVLIFFSFLETFVINKLKIVLWKIFILFRIRSFCIKTIETFDLLIFKRIKNIYNMETLGNLFI